jgi:hypothetical protein
MQDLERSLLIVESHQSSAGSLALLAFIKAEMKDVKGACADVERAITALQKMPPGLQRENLLAICRVMLDTLKC